MQLMRKSKRDEQKLRKTEFDFDDYLSQYEADEEDGWSWKYYEHAAGPWRYGRVR